MKKSQHSKTLALQKPLDASLLINSFPRIPKRWWGNIVILKAFM
jgi:hypothetical protein